MFKSYEGGEPVATIKVGKGIFASRNTLNIMKHMILRGSKRLEVRQVAEQVVAGIQRDCEKALAIWEFVTSRTDYQKDPQGFEYIKTPLYILDELAQGIRPQLDCDDMAVLSLAMLASVGVPVSLRAASYRKDRKFTHVYGLVYLNVKKSWMPIDCVNKSAGPGWEKKPYTKIMNWKVN